MSTSLRKPRRLAKSALALAAGAAFLASAAMPARAMGPGSALFGNYDASTPFSTDFKVISAKSAAALDDSGVIETGAGDSILRLIDPAGNANFAFGRVVDQCAMIYVFDNDEEMGECCGCPITPAQLATFSFEQNLLNNWGLPSSAGDGIVVVRSGLINNTSCVSFSNPFAPSLGCNGGCDPKAGFDSGSPLLGSITNVQQFGSSPSTLTEVPLFSNGNGDASNNTYLIEQCALLVGNDSGAGICNCPAE